jgi:hypothetical protein
MAAPSGEVRLTADKISIANGKRLGQGIELNSASLQGVKLSAPGTTATMNANGIDVEGGPDVKIRASGTIDLKAGVVKINDAPQTGN